MKICFVICEYNPFHNGHLLHLNHVRDNLKPDATVCLMSGNFTQRGDIAVLDKFTRATHAVRAGADMVLELPTVFATANAEIFAKGAIKIISSICANKTLCFGAETDNLNDIYLALDTTLYESDDFKKELKQQLKSGVSFAKARSTAILSVSKIDKDILTKPNNILGLEYVKAIKKRGDDIVVDVFKRQGANYNDCTLNGDISSAMSIRNAIKSGKVDDCLKAVPTFCQKDLPNGLVNIDGLIAYSILNSKTDFISSVQDCSEGLENAIKKALQANFTFNDIVTTVKSKRYTETRIKRILISTLLKIDKNFIKDCLTSDLYYKVLAIKKDRLDLLNVLSKSKYPLITRKGDEQKLSPVAKLCFLKDCFASSVYQIATNKKLNDYEMKKVD